MFWGLTPALDLLEEYQKINELPNEVNILLIGGTDARHVLQTLARSYRYVRPPKVNFYIMELTVETIAKQLLLLNVALQHSEHLGLIPRTKMFMELYGNTLIRPYVAKYLSSVAKDLIEMITNYDLLKEVMPNVAIDVKYKERDFIENLFKFWCGHDKFDICESWNRRLRKTLGVRYDTRNGAFDWDLHMRLHSIGASQICTQEYQSFRQNGVAFTWLESEVSKPNRSMVCVAVPNGENFVHYGYLGEMQTGPFISFGLTCEDSQFLKSTNGQNSYRATDVTERNLAQIFHEIHFREPYRHEATSDLQLGPIVMQMGDKRVIDATASVSLPQKIKNKCIKTDGMNIKFLSFSLLNLMEHKMEYHNFFDIIYCSHSYFKFLNSNILNAVSNTNCLLLIENKKNLVNLRDQHLEQFAAEIHQNLAKANLKAMPFDPCKDNYAKFVKV